MTETKEGDKITFDFTLQPGGSSRFAVGQLVHHKLFDYRGVVVDVHPRFQGTEEWYDNVAETNPPKDQPWYEVLVHDTARVTYVAERNLELDLTGMPVAHPLIRVFFTEFDRGHYRVGGLKN